MYKVIDDAVRIWISQFLVANQTLRDDIIQNKAKQFAIKFGITGFTASAGWLTNFKRRNNVRSYIKSGETASEFSLEEINEYRQKISENLSEYLTSHIPLTTDTMTRTALKNAIIKSFDNCIKDCKNWELKYTLQYLEESHIKFDEKDYSFIKQEVINKAIDMRNNSYTTKLITKKAKSIIRKLQSLSKVSNGGMDNRQFQDFQKNYLAIPSHSFILDIKNETIMKLFDKKDQEYIKTYNIMNNPELEDRLMEYLITFNETDISKMRDKINAGIDITPYDPKNHFDYQYVYQVFANLLPRYELRSGDFTQTHLEGWLNSNIWNIIIDSYLIDLYTVEFIRESAEIRSKISRKCDEILRELASIKEYAVNEEGKLFTGKVERNTYQMKVNKLGMDFVKSQHLEIVGFLHLDAEDLIFLIHEVLVAK
ncbi:10734_t:CDS:2, partial [Funneliformis mosseae]